MLGALGGGSDLACGGKKDSKSGDLFCTGLWPYDWGHVTGQASPGPQPFTGSLELNAGVVVLSFQGLCLCACRRKLERLPFISAHFLLGFFILMAH